MKKIIFLILIFNLTHGCYSQFNVGIKGGPSISTIIYDQKTFVQRPVNTELRIGIFGGLTFQYFGDKKIGLQFETLYIQKGFITEFDSLNNTRYERSIDYISVPFLMHAYFGKKSFNISLLLGPYTSYAMSSKEFLTEGTVKTGRSYEFDPEIDNRFEFGLQGGIGLRNTFKFGIIEIQGIFSFTFTGLYKWNAVNKDPEMDRFFELPELAQSQGYQISVSYYYPF